jgi:Ca2+-binding EF-hand superfamily protein
MFPQCHFRSFRCIVLVALQKVEQEDIDDIMDLFRKLDKSRTGTINKADLTEQYRLNIKPGVALLADQQLSQSATED